MKATRWWQVKGVVRAGDRRGAILGMVMVIVVALSLIGMGLIQLGQFNAVEVVRSYNSNKAFEAAEAGIYHARTMLRGSASFRNSPTSLTGANPVYGVSTTAEGSDLFTLRSTGMVASATRVVWQSVFAGEVPPAAFNYALFGGDGNLDLRRSAGIEGDVFQNGPINIKPPVVVTNGTVSATDPTDISPSSLPIVPPPDPTPTFPLFDPTATGAGYDGLISAASGGTATNSLGPVNLNGMTNLIKSSDLAIVGDIIGPGVLVVSGGVSLDANVSFTHNVHIISGGSLDLNCDTLTAGTNCLIYCRSDITATKDVSLGTLTLITMGDVGPGGGLNKDLSLVGVLYAAGEIKSKKDLFVTGSMLAGEGIDIAMDFSLTYSNLWPVPLLPGFTPDFVITNLFWREVFQ